VKRDLLVFTTMRYILLFLGHRLQCLHWTKNLWSEGNPIYKQGKGNFSPGNQPNSQTLL